MSFRRFAARSRVVAFPNGSAPVLRLLLRLAATGAALTVTHGAFADPATVSPEQGYDLGTIQNPRDLAFGGAQNALGGSTSSLYGNPGGLPLTRVYHFEGLALISPEARRQTYGGGVVDSSTGRLAGGFGGTWSMQDPDGMQRTWTDFRLVLAYPLSDRLAIGATGRYLRLGQNIAAGPLGASLASDGTQGGPLINAITFDVGGTIDAGKGVRIGAVAHNLTNPGTAFAPTTVTGGVGYSTDTFSFEADALADFTTWSQTRARYMAGGELFLGGHFPLRAGYRYDDGYKTHAVSAGLGYIEKRWSFEISARRDIAGEHPMTTLIAGLRVFFESAAAAEAGSGATF